MIDYVQLSDNLEDPSTKGLTCELVYKISMGMGLRPTN